MTSVLCHRVLAVGEMHTVTAEIPPWISQEAFLAPRCKEMTWELTFPHFFLSQANPDSGVGMPLLLKHASDPVLSRNGSASSLGHTQCRNPRVERGGALSSGAISIPHTRHHLHAAVPDSGLEKSDFKKPCTFGDPVRSFSLCVFLLLKSI